MAHFFGRARLAWLDVVVLTIAVPVCLSAIVYFGFVTGYTTNVFSPESFLAQYNDNIFRYRVLGKELLLAVDALVQIRWKPLQLPFVSWFDPQGVGHFYLSYFLLNTCFAVLTAIASFVVFSSSHFRQAPVHGLVLAVSGLVALSQFVVVPYDNVAFFQLFVAAGLILGALRHGTLRWQLGLATVVVLGALTRETIALALAFYAALIVVRHGAGAPIRRDVAALAAQTGVFVATYLALRFWLGFENAVAQSVNWSISAAHPLSLFSVGLALSAFYLLARYAPEVAARRAYTAFMVFLAPYWGFVVVAGILVEFRLFTPVILLLLVLAFLDYERLLPPRVRRGAQVDEKVGVP